MGTHHKNRSQHQLDLEQWACKLHGKEGPSDGWEELDGYCNFRYQLCQ